MMATIFSLSRSVSITADAVETDVSFNFVLFVLVQRNGNKRGKYEREK